MNSFKVFVLAMLVLLGGCSVLEDYRAENNLRHKIEFDLNQFDEDGLYGPDDGKRLLNYEFCIPGTIDAVQAVLDIDPTAIIYEDSKGRVNCSENQYLAMGDTFQKAFRTTLQQLANLDFVTRIVEVYFE